MKMLSFGRFCLNLSRKLFRRYIDAAVPFLIRAADEWTFLDQVVTMSGSGTVSSNNDTGLSCHEFADKNGRLNFQSGRNQNEYM